MQLAKITARSQVKFEVSRFVISNAGTPGGAADWIVNDIKIGGVLQFVQSSDLPGNIFATSAINTPVRFDTAESSADIEVTVTYIGPHECGCPFFGALVGRFAEKVGEVGNTDRVELTVVGPGTRCRG